MDREDRTCTAADQRAIVAATAAMILPIAAAAGCRFINPSLVDGLLQAAAEGRGFDAADQALGRMERELLDAAFPHQVELTRGPWLDALPGFASRDLDGLCALHLLRLADEDANTTPPKHSYLVCFTDQKDATLFRLNFA